MKRVDESRVRVLEDIYGWYLTVSLTSFNIDDRFVSQGNYRVG